MDPKRWKNPAIGEGGKKRKLEAVNRDIAQLDKELNVYSNVIPALKGTGRDSFLRISEFEAEKIISSAKQFLELPVLEEAIIRLTADMNSIDRSEIETLRQRLQERESALGEINLRIRRQEKDTGSIEKELKTCNEETLPKLENEEKDLLNSLEISYEKDWARETGSPRYDRELIERLSADEIYKAFSPMLSRSRTVKDRAWESTRDHRIKYNDTYKTGYDVNAPDNNIFNQVLTDCTENKLPDYESKIEDTRQKAYQQFQEDFLSKLQSNIRNARTHIDELNRAMKSASFGEDTYQFRMIANPEYKRFYDMIVDEMLLVGGYNLASDHFNTKYKEELEDLFKIITNDSSAQNALGYEDYEKRIQVFTDYKTYLQFDLEVIKPSGESERLSKTMGKKSGGETQTPFYIAVLASFVQLYRMGRDKVSDTIRLILFDEAFSKMDGERIIQSIGLLRHFNFQVIFAAPPDKIPDIATLADKNLWVLRDGHKAGVRVFEPRQQEEFINAG
jgi:uncharacterized protein YPO0396